MTRKQHTIPHAIDHGTTRHAYLYAVAREGERLVAAVAPCGAVLDDRVDPSEWAVTGPVTIDTLTCPICRDMNGLPAYGDPQRGLGTLDPAFPSREDEAIMDAVAAAQDVVFAGAAGREYRFVQATDGDGRIITLGSVARLRDPYGWRADSYYQPDDTIFESSLTAAVDWLRCMAGLPAVPPPLITEEDLATSEPVDAALVRETVATIAGSRFYRPAEPMTHRMLAHAVRRTLDRIERDHGAGAVARLDRHVGLLGPEGVDRLYAAIEARLDATRPPDPRRVKVREVLDGRYVPTEYDGLTVARHRIKGDRLVLTLETGVDAGGTIEGLNVMLDATQVVVAIPATAS